MNRKIDYDSEVSCLINNVKVSVEGDSGSHLTLDANHVVMLTDRAILSIQF